MSKTEKNTRKQIEILKAQLAENKSKDKHTNNSVNKLDNSAYTEVLIDPKFYKSSLIKTFNITLVIVTTLLLLYIFQDKWIGLINLNF